mgnify:CR=1 FL=1
MNHGKDNIKVDVMDLPSHTWLTMMMMTFMSHKLWCWWWLMIIDHLWCWGRWRCIMRQEWVKSTFWTWPVTPGWWQWWRWWRWWRCHWWWRWIIGIKSVLWSRQVNRGWVKAEVWNWIATIEMLSSPIGLLQISAMQCYCYCYFALLVGGLDKMVQKLQLFSQRSQICAATDR